jgi:transcriptional regulator with XRE-family HTH domain
MDEMKVIEVVNAALDRARQEHGLTDEALARLLGVEASTLWRWRSGKISKATRILIPLILCSKHPADQAA